MITNLLFFLFLTLGTIPFIVFFAKQFEECLPVTIISIVLVEFVFGIIGYLKIGFYATCLIILVGFLCACFYSIKKKTILLSLKALFSPGFVIFIFQFIILTFLNYGRLASRWDEFSHWMDVVKVTTILDDFATNPNSHSLFQSYPPAMSLFQYFLQKIFFICNRAGVFNEWRVYFAYQIFSLSFFFPFFKDFVFKKSFEGLCISTTYFLSILILFPNFYSNVYIDPVLGIVSGCSIASIYLDDIKDSYTTFRLFLSCAVLVLLKDVGLLFSIFIIIMYTIKNYSKVELTNKRFYLITFLGIASVAFPRVLWKIEIATSHANVRFGNRISPFVLINVLLGKDKGYRRTVLSSYINGFLNQGLTIGNTNIKINYFMFTILCLVFIAMIYYLTKKNNDEKLQNKRVSFIFVLLVVVYIVGLLNTYMTNFSEYEATRIAAFSRYLSTLFLTIVICSFIVVSKTICKLKIQNFICVLLFLTFTMFLVPTEILYYVGFRKGVKSSIENRACFVPIENEIKRNCKPDNTITVISQWDSGFDALVITYNARPIVVSGPPTIGEPKSAEDIWTQRIYKDEWQKLLVEDYDYVAIYKTNDFFYKEYASLFEDEILQNRVYKVNKKTGMLELCK